MASWFLRLPTPERARPGEIQAAAAICRQAAATRQALAGCGSQSSRTRLRRGFGTAFALTIARAPGIRPVLRQARSRSTVADPGSNIGLFGVHGAALELRSQRMGVLTSNIANAATPGYKARDIDFSAALKARLGGAGTDQAVSAATRYRVPVMPSLDGNTVELGAEQVAFSQNAVGYSASLQFLTGRVNTITRAIKGE